MDEASKNTDVELWREDDNAYAPSIHLTEDGSIGISLGGTVHVKNVRRWHQLAEDDMERGLWGDQAKCSVAPYEPNEVEKLERYINLLCMVNQAGHKVDIELSEAIRKYREVSGI